MSDSSLRYVVLYAASDLLHRVMDAEGDGRRRELAGEATAQSEIHVDSRYVGHRHHLHTSAYVSTRQLTSASRRELAGEAVAESEVHVDAARRAPIPRVARRESAAHRAPLRESNSALIEPS